MVVCLYIYEQICKQIHIVKHLYSPIHTYICEHVYLPIYSHSIIYEHAYLHSIGIYISYMLTFHYYHNKHQKKKSLVCVLLSFQKSIDTLPFLPIVIVFSY